MDRPTFIYNIAKILGMEQDHSFLAMLDSKLEHWMRSFYRILVANKAQEADKLIQNVSKTYLITISGWNNISHFLPDIFDCIECAIRLEKVTVTPPGEKTREARYVKVLDRDLYNYVDQDIWMYTVNDNVVYVTGYCNNTGNLVINYIHHVFVPFDNMHEALQDGLHDYILSQLAPVIYAQAKAARKENRKRNS